MSIDKIVIGVIPTRRDCFSVEEAKKYKKIINEKIKTYSICDIIDIEDINEEGILFDEKDVAKVVDKMKKGNVCGLFFPHVNFGSEDLVAKVAKQLNVPVLIWGPRDDAPLADGERTRDTQCGLFATGKVLRRYNVPFTYLPNTTVDDISFVKGYAKFIAVCATVRDFKKARILQISTRPSAFYTMMCNEGELLEKFGVSILPISHIDMVTAVDKILSLKGYDFRNAYENVTTNFNCGNVDKQLLDKIVGLKAYFDNMSSEYGISAIAIQCWHAMQQAMGIMPCAANGLMTDQMVPVTCETDIHGAISSIILQAASMYQSPIFFADLTVRHPSNDNAELLWHCGNFPTKLAKDKQLDLGKHFIFDSHCLGTGEFQLQDGEITICRFDGDHGDYKLLFTEGKTVEGPKTKGTYVWFEMKDLIKFEKKIVEGPYVHHCSGVYANVAEILNEVCKYIGVTADPFGMTLNQIEDIWLTGKR